ncbi:hypothetical protein SK128_004911 [Halocaridina rubra]|uniref:Ig-like domain-containing protein n=1 Tax=Halocaridina rubra TaxID=373956 RepID=A0AAN8WX48_HALRR
MHCRKNLRLNYDMRPGAGRSHWMDDSVLGSRALLDVTVTPAELLITDVKASDAGLYKCRVDFRRQPTKTTRVSLSVLIPPRRVFLVSNGVPVTTVIGPFREGDKTSLTCVSQGGWPRPRVLWYMEGRLIDADIDQVLQADGLVEPEPNSKVFLPRSARTLHVPQSSNNPNSIRKSKSSNNSISIEKPTSIRGPQKLPQELQHYSVENTITLGPLRRSDLKKLVTCESSNTNLTSPTTAAVMIDMNLEPLSVEVFGPEEPLSSGKEYELICEVVGSRPPPSITWWKTAVRVHGSRERTAGDGNTTSSTLAINPVPLDDRSSITCRAENPATNSVLEQSISLTVYYIPETQISLGSSLDSQNIKEGDDVYFECAIQANPRAYKVVWKHNQTKKAVFLSTDPGEGKNTEEKYDIYRRHKSPYKSVGRVKA